MPVVAGIEAMALSNDRVTRSMARAAQGNDAVFASSSRTSAKEGGGTPKNLDTKSRSELKPSDEPKRKRGRPRKNPKESPALNTKDPLPMPVPLGGQPPVNSASADADPIPDGDQTSPLDSEFDQLDDSLIRLAEESYLSRFCGVRASRCGMDDGRWVGKNR
ncbi:hypothetical protein B0H10DRAFT_2433928 [Mycena sp. CBHHK59/15]|nr:hypothetical protein B0H10DRAFT_2433928 [Mycena sp. CBHHK59/15]